MTSQMPLAKVHNLPAYHSALSCMTFDRFLPAGMSSCAVQMSLRCAEVAPGAKPSVEGDDGADWCVVDAGKPLHFLLIKLSCIAVLQPRPILNIAQSDVACKEADIAALLYSMALPSHAPCITTLGQFAHKHWYGAKPDLMCMMVACRQRDSACVQRGGKGHV